MFSCSKNDDAPASSIGDSILLKKTISTIDNAVITNNYSYNGKKIISVTSDDGYEQNFTYNGNLITSIQANNYGSISNTTFEYNSNGKLIWRKIFFNYTGEEFVIGYNYNSDGTITIDNYTDNYISSKEKHFFINNEVVRIESTTLLPYPSATTVKNLTYDLKNNPFKNIIGFDQFYGIDVILNRGKYRNLLTYESSDSSSSTVYEYNYNSLNFPSKSTSRSNNGPNVTIQYFY